MIRQDVFLLSHDRVMARFFVQNSKEKGKKHHGICKHLLGSGPTDRRDSPCADHQGDLQLTVHRHPRRRAVRIGLQPRRHA